MSGKIIVIDDESSMLDVIEAMLLNEKYEVQTFVSAKNALDHYHIKGADLIISDIRMSPLTGIDVLKEVKSTNPELPVILITAFANAEDALESVKIGAYDYIQKPFKIGKLRSLIKRALSISKALSQKNKEESSNEKQSVKNFHGIITKNPVMKKIFEMVKKAAPSKTTLLIQGDSGTGKELFAKAIHNESGRAQAPFIAINCGALSPQLLESELFGHKKGSFTGAISDKDGLFTVAGNGTIFLDEISTMSLSLQTKLLRVLQEKEIRPVGSTSTITISCRVIVATNESLEELIIKNAFREDLYYRLSIIPIELPPLRDRLEDLVPIIEYFINKYAPNKNLNISPSVMNSFMAYNWPGNIRELENAIERITTLCSHEEITLDDLPPIIKKKHYIKSDYPEEQLLSLKIFSSLSIGKYVTAMLKKFNNDKDETAKALETDIQTLNKIIKDFENTHNTQFQI